MKTRLIHEVRAVKSKKELANIIKAQRVSEKVLTDVLKYLKTGISELEVERFIRRSFVKYGAPILAFDPMVAFGKNTANIHHFVPTKTKLKVGDTIMLDFGCTANHYCSDMTRTYFWGKPSAQQAKVYNAVLKAQMLAIKIMQYGERRAGFIDRHSRKFLDKMFKKNFQHRIGHGVGTVIHEWPNFGPTSKDILPTGCVMTVEPGIYLKGKVGVRIEDMLLITKKGCKSLTNFPKDLQSAILRVK